MQRQVKVRYGSLHPWEPALCPGTEQTFPPNFSSLKSLFGALAPTLRNLILSLSAPECRSLGNVSAQQRAILWVYGSEWSKQEVSGSWAISMLKQRPTEARIPAPSSAAGRGLTGSQMQWANSSPVLPSRHRPLFQQPSLPPACPWPHDAFLQVAATPETLLPGPATVSLRATAEWASLRKSTRRWP